MMLWDGLVTLSIAGVRARMFAVADGEKQGFAFTPDGRYMVVSYFTEHVLHVYRSEQDGTSTLPHN